MTCTTRIRNFSVTIGLAIEACSPAGDAEFRKAMFGSTATGTGPRVISDRVALSLSDGFFGRERPGTAIGPRLSLALLCLDYGRSDLLREVVLADHPAVVDQVGAKHPAMWMWHLSSTKFQHVRSYVSLVSEATRIVRPCSAEFVELALQIGSDSSYIDGATTRGGAEAAVVTEARMLLRMRELRESGALTPEAGLSPAPARRRNVSV